MQRRKNGFQAWRNRTTIRNQLSLLVGLAVAMVIGLLIFFNYNTQARANVNQQIELLTRVLALENQRMGTYVDDLLTFSLQMRSNSDFMTIVTQTEALSYSQQQVIKTALKTAYYARNDLVEIELYLVNHRQLYALDSVKQQVLITEGVSAQDLPGYQTFTAKPNFYSITPDDQGLMCLTRTIIDAPRDTPLALVRFTVNGRGVEPLEASHQVVQEQLCMFGTEGERYVVPQGLAPAEIIALQQGLQTKQTSYITAIGGEPNLCVAVRSAESVFILVGYKPMTVVNAALIATRNGSIAIGIIALAFTVLLSETFIRYITEPLNKLAHRLRRVGTGNFQTKETLEGSYELIGLSEDLNRMMADINGLIEHSYVATLNERTAQLAALEAQINPHFLFNTLQAIASEAIQNQQMQLYQMVTALAALLRYSIKGGNLARLDIELSHVDKYLMLQKARFGDRLTYQIHAEDALLRLQVPKLGMLSLAENSIVHGLSGAAQCIHIELDATVEDENACLSVRDNGLGIAPDKLTELRLALKAPAVTLTQSVGLLNLASRLKLLYNGKATIELSSEPNPRQTTVSLRIPLEVLGNG